MSSHALPDGAGSALHSPLLPLNAVALDFETAHYDANSACALGLVKIENAQITQTWYHLIRPPKPQVLFTEIHGLTWSMLKAQPTFAELWSEIAHFIAGADYFIAHNAAFDKRVLYASCKAAGIESPRTPFCCTLQGARKNLPLASRKLNVVCNYYGITLDHHNAASDAHAAAAIFLRLQKAGIPLKDLRIR
jgi:DNA polymerase III subunit epsilon